MTGRTRTTAIRDHRRVTEPEWIHLNQVLARLVADGNSVRRPFQPSQGGWWCAMSKPLNPVVSTSLVAEDPRLEFVQAEDYIWCRHCWAAIHGANHRPPA